MGTLEDLANGIKLYSSMMANDRVVATRDIMNMDVFVSLLDESTLTSAKCYAQMLIAKQLKKPVLYIIPKGTVLPLPEEYTDGFEFLKIIEMNSTVITDDINTIIVKEIDKLYNRSKGIKE